MNGIGYVDRTWNVMTGCTPCSPGCANCWARTTATRLASNPRILPENRERYRTFEPTFWSERLNEPAHWRKPQRVAVAFMGDMFHEHFGPEEWLALHGVMAANPRHTFLTLTKRAQRQAEWRRRRNAEILANEWVGVTVCNQEEADAKIPWLLSAPAPVRWISIEPMLGPIDLVRWLDRRHSNRLSWAVLGGENGKEARPIHPAAVLEVAEQCEMAGVPFWFKGWGAWAPVRFWRAGESYVKVETDESRLRLLGDRVRWPLVNMEKRGRPGPGILAGREWRELPEVFRLRSEESRENTEKRRMA